MQLSKKFRVECKNKGFTLFEMVVVIVVVCILYAVAGSRLTELPAAAERVTFYGVLSQMRSGANFEMIKLVASGKKNELDNLDGYNPMNFLLEQPENYLGEVDVFDAESARNSHWYYESSTGELVYTIGEASLVDVTVTMPADLVNSGQIRLKLLNVYRQPDVKEGLKRRWEGLLIEPVYPFLWQKRSEALTEIGLEQ